DKIHAREIFGKPALATAAGFGFQPVDEVDDGVEAAARAAADASPRNGNGQMRLTGAGSADQHSIALLDNKGAAGEIAHQSMINRRLDDRTSCRARQSLT